MGNCVFDKHGVFVYFLPYCAEMVELVDTRDLKSLGLIACTGSSPVLGIFYCTNTTKRIIVSSRGFLGDGMIYDSAEKQQCLASTRLLVGLISRPHNLLGWLATDRKRAPTCPVIRP